MKDAKTKEAFITLRAEGKSYSAIAKELKISKGTCTSWEKELKANIDELKQERLQDLYTTYQMTREARITKLGETIKAMDKAQEEIDFTLIPEDKLLTIKLRYEQELQKEYQEPSTGDTDNTLNSLLEQYNQLYEDNRAGRISATDVKARLSILEAKKKVIEEIADEEAHEEKNIFDTDLSDLKYTSKLLRRA